jgi:parallel beta-helix repeat protein
MDAYDNVKPKCKCRGIRKMDKKYVSLVICAAILFLSFVGTASAGTWYVDDDGGADFTGIQEAINNASDGDTIIVHSGVYHENVVVNKSVTLIGNGQPVVDAEEKGNAISLTADGITLVGFTATSERWMHAGINVISNNNTLTGNNACNNRDGIRLYYPSNNNTITGNNVCNNNYNGIFLEPSSNNNTIAGNNVSNNNYKGIYIFDSSNNTIAGNNVSNNGGTGISICSSSNNTITGNNVCNIFIVQKTDYDDIFWLTTPLFDGHGIHLFNSSNNTITGNNVSNNNYNGFFLQSSSNNNTIAGNNVSNNNYNGFFLQSSSNNNTITGNNVSNNNYKGIYLTTSSNNTIYFNNFINDIDNVYSSKSTNIWNSPLKITYTYDGTTYESYLGNYWSDYSGSDTDGDGIGNTPYHITSNCDNYPLMEPLEVYLGKQTYQSPLPTPTPMPEQKTWHFVVFFSGSESGETPSFNITGDEWRVKWVIEPSTGGLLFMASARRFRPLSESVGSWVSVDSWKCDSGSPHEGIQHIYEGKGSYSFKVSCMFVDNWLLTVEDYY